MRLQGQRRGACGCVGSSRSVRPRCYSRFSPCSPKFGVGSAMGEGGARCGCSVVSSCECAHDGRPRSIQPHFAPLLAPTPIIPPSSLEGGMGRETPLKTRRWAHAGCWWLHAGIVTWGGKGRQSAWQKMSAPSLPLLSVAFAITRKIGTTPRLFLGFFLTIFGSCGV